MPSLPSLGTKPWKDQLEAWLLVGHDAAGNNLGAGPDANKVDKDSVVNAATRIVANKLLAGDTQPNFRILGSGRIDWGVGGATAPVLGLYFDPASPTDLRVIGGGLTVNQGAAGHTHITGDGNSTVYFGNAYDTNIYRKSAGELATSGYFTAYNRIYASSGAYSVEIGNSGGYSAMWLYGPAGERDTNVWRKSASNLATDGTFWASQFVVAGTDNICFGSALDTKLYRWQANWLKTDGGLNTRNGLLASAASNGWGFWTSIDGEPNYRFLITHDGMMRWTDGTTQDTSLYRAGVNALGTAGSFYAGTNIVSRSGLNQQIFLGDLGDTNPAIGLGSGAGISLRRDGAGLGNKLQLFGATAFHLYTDTAQLQFGSAADTVLYRSGANILKTDDSFHIGSGGILALNNSPQQIEMAWSGSSRQYRHTISTQHVGGAVAGNWIDFNIWTSADSPDALGTTRALRVEGDGAVIVGGALFLGGQKDVYLYRYASTQIRCKNDFLVEGSLTVFTNINYLGKNIVSGAQDSGGVGYRMLRITN